MILGRSATLWKSLVAALAAAVIAGAKAAGIIVDVEFVGAVVTVAFVAIGIIANEADPNTVSTFALSRTAPIGGRRWNKAR
jgi:hypothetical protein